MITIQVRYKNQQIIYFHSTGHANYNSYGHDIVCAGVSSIIFGLLNALDQLSSDVKLKVADEANITIIPQKLKATTDLILQVGLIQLKTMQQQFPENIQIVEEKP